MKSFSALIILILLFSMLLAAPLTPVVAHTEPPEWGNWVVEDDTTIENETIIIHGNVIIRNDGVLTLKNCVLEISSGNKIEVEETGTFYVYDSTIKNYRIGGFYRFDVYGKLITDGSDINGMFKGLRILDNGNARINNSMIHDNDPVACGITVNDANATITNSRFYNTYGGVICKGSSNVTLIGNDFSETGDIGIYAEDDVTAYITDNTISGNWRDGIELLRSASAEIINNTISSCDIMGINCLDDTVAKISGNIIKSNGNVGIICGNTASAEITGNTISDNRKGVDVGDNSTVKIVDNNIIDSNDEYGVGCYHSASVEISDSIISNNEEEGIHCQLSQDGKLTAQNNLVYNNKKYGVVITDKGLVEFYDNQVLNHEKHGMWIVNGASPIISNCTVANTGESGIFIRDTSTPKIYNSTIINSDKYDIWVGEHSSPKMINVNFDLNKLFFNDTESIISIGHWLDVNVCNKNNVPVQNAEITIKNSNGIEVFNGITDYDGHVSCIPVVEYDLDWTFNKTVYTPHHIYASKLGKSDSEKITVDRNRVVDFILDISNKLARGNLVTKVVEGHEVSVEYSGNGTVTINPAGGVPEIPEDIKDIGIFFDLKTEGEVEELYITVRYSDEELEGVNEADLRMYCYLDPGEYDPGEYDPGEYDPGEYDPGEYGGWVMIKNSGVDIHSNTVWAKVNHTTIFAPMARETSKQTGPGTTATWLWYSSIVAVLAILLLTFIPVMVKKKRF